MTVCIVPGLLTLAGGDRYLLQNMDWLEEELGGFEDDYLIFDCPGMPLHIRSSLLHSERIRSNRAVHPSSLSSDPCAKSLQIGYTYMRSISYRVTIYGRQV
jgi:hypothetical protein